MRLPVIPWVGSLGGLLLSFTFGTLLPLAGQEVTVSLSPDTLPAIPGTTCTFDTRINIVGGGGFGDHVEFSIQIQPSLKAHLILDSQGTSNVEILEPGGSRDFQIRGTPSGASGSLRYTVELQEGVQPGEYQFSVEGGQGLQLLGVVASNRLFRSNIGRLVITAPPAQQASAATTPPVDPPTTPPFTPTGTTVPSPGATDPAKIVAFGLAAAMLLIAVGALTRRRGGQNNAPAAATRIAPADLPPHVPVAAAASHVTPAELPPRVPPVAAARAGSPGARTAVEVSDLPPATSGPLQYILRDAVPVYGSPVVEPSVPPTPPIPEDMPPNRPTPEVTVVLTATPTEFNGDGSVTVSLQVRIVKGPPDAVIQGVGFRWFDWTPAQRAPVEFDKTNDAAKYDFSWYWDDIHPTCEADVVVLIPSWPRKFYKPRPQRVTITIRGANPRFHVNCSNTLVDGTGRDGIDLTGTLEIFGQPAGPLEQVHVAQAEALVHQQSFDHLEWIEDPATARRQARWIAPFLMLRPPDAGVHTELVVRGAWTGGPMWERAGRPNFEKTGRALLNHFVPSNVNLEHRVPIHILGCTLQHKPTAPLFLPLPGTPLQVEGRLARCEGGAMSSPFTSGAVRSDDAGIQLHIEDRTQGPVPQPHNGCKIPAGPVASGPKRTVPLMVADDGHFWTTGQLTYEEQQRRSAARIPPGHGLHAVLMTYTPQAHQEPVHQGPLIYTITVCDGLGPDVEYEGVCRVVLKSLLMETGGLDFRMYEHRPQAFQLEVANQNDEGVYVHQPYWSEPLKLIWEFAIVDERGRPLASGHRVETSAAAPSHGVSYPLWVGRWRPGASCESYCFTEVDRANSLALRRRWHEWQLSYGKDEEALTWLRSWTADTALSGQLTGSWAPASASDTANAAYQRSPWTDRVLAMAVRVELRTADGCLLGTSDREQQGMRTPPALVWGDHCFRYVLAKLRLNLQDARGRPYARRRYALTLCSATPATLGADLDPVPGDELAWIEDATADEGRLERLVMPNAEVGVLKFFPGPEGAQREAWCEFVVDLGGLAPAVEDQGMRDRLANLGLCPGDLPDSEQCRRAIERLQTLWDQNPTGSLDTETRKRLDAAHQTGRMGGRGERS